MQMMRRGKYNQNYPYYNIKKQNDAGMMVGICMLVACLIILIGLTIK